VGMDDDRVKAVAQGEVHPLQGRSVAKYFGHEKRDWRR
jgi:hypothetical protein